MTRLPGPRWRTVSEVEQQRRPRTMPIILGMDHGRPRESSRMIEAVALRRLPDISMRSQHVRRGVHGWRSGVTFRTHGRVLGAAFVVVGAPACDAQAGAIGADHDRDGDLSPDSREAVGRAFGDVVDVLLSSRPPVRGVRCGSDSSVTSLVDINSSRGTRNCPGRAVESVRGDQCEIVRGQAQGMEPAGRGGIGPDVRRHRTRSSAGTTR